MKLLIAYLGRSEYRCFIGPERVGTIHLLHGMYYPQAAIKGVTRTCGALRSMEAAQEWILKTLREMGRTK